jgi:hypothetical protein
MNQIRVIEVCQKSGKISHLDFIDTIFFSTLRLVLQAQLTEFRNILLLIDKTDLIFNFHQ